MMLNLEGQASLEGGLGKEEEHSSSWNSMFKGIPGRWGEGQVEKKWKRAGKGRASIFLDAKVESFWPPVFNPGACSLYLNPWLGPSPSRATLTLKLGKCEPAKSSTSLSQRKARQSCSRP